MGTVRTVRRTTFAPRAPRATRSTKDSENCGGDFREVMGAGRTGRKEQNHAKIKQQDVEYV